MSQSKLILVFNCGSSSIKFALVDPVGVETLMSGVVQKIGKAEADLQIRYVDPNRAKHYESLPNISYRNALQLILDIIRSDSDLHRRIGAIGHRIVHGGEDFLSSMLITADVLAVIKKCNLAPLHTAAHVMGIEGAHAAFPQLLQVAVFDTAFHQTMPAHAFVYPIPYEYYKQYKIRRYGFHGTSHRFVSGEAAKTLLKNLADSAFIVAHLGNGCSATAILYGKSVDTSMGLTPLEGLMMGTRSGDVDPNLHAHLVDNLGLDVHKVTEILNKKSGLLGVSGSSYDMRAIEVSAGHGDERAILALEIFCYRLAKYISALTVPISCAGHIDALIFTAGIGENSACVRAKTLGWLKFLGFKIDDTRNVIHGKDSNGIITVDGDSTIAMVVSTNEELLIAQDTAALALSK